MEKIKVLHHDWGYPVCQNPNQLHTNLVNANNWVQHKMGYNPRQFVSLGTSGAMLLGALSFAYGIDIVRQEYILFRKPEDTTAEGKYYQTLNPKLPIIIIDDHITSGSTIWKIALEIARQSLIDNVIGVIAQSWDNDNLEYVAKHEKLLADYFPCIKFWLY